MKKNEAVVMNFLRQVERRRPTLWCAETPSYGINVKTSRIGIPFPRASSKK